MKNRNSIYTIIWLILVLLVLNCTNNQKIDKKDDWLKVINEKYTNVKNEYFLPKELFTQFPRKIDSLPVIQSYGLEDYQRYIYYIVAFFNYNIDSLMVLQKEYHKYALTSNDSEVYVMKETDTYDVIKKNLCEGKKPIPDFRIANLIIPEENIQKKSIYSDETLSGLIKDYNIYP